MRPGLVAALAGVALLLTLASPVASATSYRIPVAGDGFDYTESIAVGSGVGNYTGYTDITGVNGSIAVTAVAANGTESADYANTDNWHDNAGQSQASSEQGSFTFSATTFHYVNGTDNQSGYVDPYVWFYIDGALPVGSQFYVLNTAMTVESRNASFATSASSSGYASTVSAQGTGSFQRNDSYGVFTATYTWDAYYDPSTGYIVGYLYTEQDRDAAGDGFTETDHLAITSASYSVSPTSAPPSSSSGSSTPVLEWVAVGIVVLVLIVVLVVVLARRGRTLPRHAPPPAAGPGAWTPPPVQFGGSSAPPPQVVLRETVKVNCKFCGTLIDSTDTVCPKCGAPRT